MLAEQRFVVAFLGVAHAGVESTAAGRRFMSPDDWMIRTHRTAAVACFIDRGEHRHGVAGIASEVVPFVAPPPRRWQPSGGRMSRGFNGHRRSLTVGWLAKYVPTSCP